MLNSIYRLQENPATAMVDADLFFDTLSVAQLAKAVEFSH